MSTVSDILKIKGNTIWSVSRASTVIDTLKMMADKNLGAVLVMDGATIAGIFSERDFARHTARHSLRPEEVLITDMMTSKIHFIKPSQSTDECMSLMTTLHIRHLPVMDEGKLIGLISIGDVVKRIIEDHKFSITQLENYVIGNNG